MSNTCDSSYPVLSRAIWHKVPQPGALMAYWSVSAMPLHFARSCQRARCGGVPHKSPNVPTSAGSSGRNAALT